jgi:hypothetical protein
MELEGKEAVHAGQPSKITLCAPAPWFEPLALWSRELEVRFLFNLRNLRNLRIQPREASPSMPPSNVLKTNIALPHRFAIDRASRFLSVYYRK